MISLYSTWWIKQENIAEVMPALKELAKKVESEEPNTWMYTIHTPNYDFPSPKGDAEPVSYTHLTLPTICSV